jgi:hypothetical protein
MKAGQIISMQKQLHELEMKEHPLVTEKQKKISWKKTMRMHAILRKGLSQENVDRNNNNKKIIEEDEDLADNDVDPDEYEGEHEINDVFISYDWKVDENGRDNKARVANINKALKKANIKTWCDSDRLDLGCNLHDFMARGIENSHVVLVCLTKNYMHKVKYNYICIFLFKIFNYLNIFIKWS